MATKRKSLMLTVPDDIAAAVADVKRTKFIDKSYSEMYRYLIRKGLDSLKADPTSIKNSR